MLLVNHAILIMSANDPRWTEVAQTQSLQLKAVLEAGKDTAVFQRGLASPRHQAV